MFDQLGWGEISVLLVLALFVFGPERLPGLARDLGRGVRKTKALLRGMTDDLKAELGPEVGDLDLRSLHPKTFVADLMRDDDDRPGKPVPSQPLRAGEPAPWDPDTT
ncbi:MAG: twin-arginine translocation protein TatB subunit [Frankiales bacterium]|nr:twin-arginine translocation protein TatB subunit [Frankiales bacterium]